MTRTKLLPVLTIALAVPLAACSSGGSSTTSTTTTTAAGSVTSSTAAPGTTASGGSSGTSGAPGSTTGGASGASTLDCADVAGLVPEVYAQPVASMDELGGICTAELPSGDRVEVLWNRNATNATSFATIVNGLDPIDVVGAGEARGGYDDMGAQVKVLIPGEGAYELSLTPDFVSARQATQADVDGLVALAAALVRERG